MSKGTPVFPDLGYAISRSAVVSVGFNPATNQYQTYSHSASQSYHNENAYYYYPSPNSSPQSNKSAVYPPQQPPYQQLPTAPQPVIMPEPSPAPAVRPEFKRRKTEPMPKPQGNRRIPRVIAAAAPKAMQKNRSAGDGVYCSQAGFAQGLNSGDDRLAKELHDALGRQKGGYDSMGNKEATVFGYVFDGTA